jgi:D-sedoheptulose 7-phosphate isomerase
MEDNLVPFPNSAHEFFKRSEELIRRCGDTPQFIDEIAAVSRAVAKSMRRGGKLLIAGNGGSAGDSQHIAGEFLSRLNFDRAPLPALALTVDSSVLTAIGNDYGYEYVFERQVRGLGNAGDVLIGITTSGKSANVIRALSAARERELTTVTFCGINDSEVAQYSDYVLAVPSASTPLIQQVHITLAHIICGDVERSLFEEPDEKSVGARQLSSLRIEADDHAS